MDKLSQLTIKDIIEAKIEFIEKNSSLNTADLELTNKGELKAYREILIDLELLDKDEFTKKYINIIRRLDQIFENSLSESTQSDSNKIEELSGYNNGIVNILGIINPIYIFNDIL